MASPSPLRSIALVRLGLRFLFDPQHTEVLGIDSGSARRGGGTQGEAGTPPDGRDSAVGGEALPLQPDLGGLLAAVAWGAASRRAVGIGWLRCVVPGRGLSCAVVRLVRRRQTTAVATTSAPRGVPLLAACWCRHGRLAALGFCALPPPRRTRPVRSRLFCKTNSLKK